MENLISCNVETLGALVLLSRMENFDLLDAIKKLYPRSCNDFEPTRWARTWGSKIIVCHKDEIDGLEDGTYMMVSSLKDEAYKTKLFNKIRKALNK